MKHMRRIALALFIPGLIIGIWGCSNPKSNPASTGFTGTQLSGVLDHDLTIGESPYALDGDVTVDAGVTVHVDPGVVVKATGDYGITVKGRLVAEGTESSWIEFTSGQKTPDRGDWKGLRLIGADDATSLRYVRMSYAGRYNLIQDTSRTYVDSLHASIMDTVLYRGAITIMNCSPTIERCIVEYGGRIEPAHRAQHHRAECLQRLPARTGLAGMVADSPGGWPSGDPKQHRCAQR